MEMSLKQHPIQKLKLILTVITFEVVTDVRKSDATLDYKTETACGLSYLLRMRKSSKSQTKNR